MERLTRHVYCFFTAAVLGAAVFAVVVFLQPTNWKLLAAVALAAALITAFLFGRGRKNITAARLIIENQILHIQPAIFREQVRKKTEGFRPGEAIEVFVSCFGILLDSKIIKFNQERVRLKAVEIGRDFILLTYGTDQKMQSIKLLHAAINDSMLAEIAEKFRYETGVIPTIKETKE